MSASSRAPANPDEVIQLKGVQPSPLNQEQSGGPAFRSATNGHAANGQPQSGGQVFRPASGGQGLAVNGQAQHIAEIKPPNQGSGQQFLGHQGQPRNETGHVPNQRNTAPFSNKPTTPLFKKMDQPEQPSFDGRQFNSSTNNRGGVVNSGVQRGGHFSAFAGGQGAQQPGGQRSWGGRSSGDGSLFGGPASMKRKNMSPEGRKNALWSFIMKYRPVVPSHISHNALSDGSLFGGPASMKRKNMSPEGRKNALWSFIMKYRPVVPSHISHNALSDGSLFGGPASMKRKNMSPEGRKNALWSFIMKYRPVVPSHISHNALCDGALFGGPASMKRKNMSPEGRKNALRSFIMKYRPLVLSHTYPIMHCVMGLYLVVLHQ